MSIKVGELIELLRNFEEEDEFLLEDRFGEEIEVNESDIYEVGTFFGNRRVLLSKK